MTDMNAGLRFLGPGEEFHRLLREIETDAERLLTSDVFSREADQSNETATVMRIRVDLALARLGIAR